MMIWLKCSLPLNSGDDLNDQQEKVSEEVAKLREEFHSRLVAANLRTEAVRAGMIDLDGLKLIDLSAFGWATTTESSAAAN